MQGAFHSDLMRPAVKKFKRALEKVELMEPIISVHSNIDGQIYGSAAIILRRLPTQMFKPLKWEQTMHILYERAKGQHQPFTYVCGPTGQVLKSYLEQVNKIAAENCSVVNI